ncbi:tyrosine-type recombinase/integrase [Methanocella arvoryzae]|uniref:Integrase n=1 Tax=Methanocella arvoryzae (strain DSM 22066 / NBRC 105507 / MRE50) TaxID=351160 RepID=Q0W0X8_METAR|nr:tyrosine-type recombinase/integrase [Methanocella arvoryzae]CAJ37965.1 integrase [Methanocella arvoryzae MRE50]
MINKRFRPKNDAYTYEVVLTKRLADGMINQTEAGIIKTYIIDKMSNGEIRDSTASLIATSLTQFRRFLEVDYNQLNITALKLGILKLRNGGDISGKAYTDNTRKKIMQHVMPFVNYMGEQGIIAEIPTKEMKKIKPPKVVKGKFQPQDILTPEEIEQFVKLCDNSRDRALIMFMYESGARVGEIGRVTWKDLTFTDTDCRAQIEDEKVGGYRYPYVVASVPYLIQLRNDMPEATESDFVFRVHSNGYVGEPLSYRTVQFLLEKLIAASGTKKPLSPHLFRASRITNMIKEGYKESIIKKMMWQKVETQMFEVYVKLADSDIQNEIKTKAGLSLKVETKPMTKPQKCVCGMVSDSLANYCPKCGRSLKEGVAELREEITEADRQILKLLKQPGKLEKLTQLLE